MSKIVVLRNMDISLISKIYVFIMLAIFPLATSDNYFDILDVKWLFTVIPTCIFILIAIILKLARKDRLKLYSSNTNMLFIPSMLLITSIVIGTFFCLEPLVSFWGITGRYLGVMVLVPLIISMLLLSTHFEYSRVILYAIAISSLIIFILQIFNEFKIDIFGMWAGLQKFEIRLFTSTIGNRNFNATYNCMILSMAVAMLVSNHKQKTTVELALSMIYIAIGFAASICLRSDGFFLGMAAALVAIVIYLVKNIEKLKGLAYVMLAFGIGSLGLLLLRGVADKSFKLKSLSAFAVDYKVIALEIIFAVIIYLLSNKFKDKTNRLILIGLVLVAIAVMLSTICLGKNPVINYSKIDDHSFHNRVYVWRMTLEYVKTFSPMQLLFGCGINDFQFGFVDFCGKEMESLGYNTFIDAHSEYLQALASTGLIGFIGYLGMLITTLIHSFKNRKNGIIAISFVITFMAQGLVYGPQITTTPILFIMLGIFWSRSFSENKL